MKNTITVITGLVGLAGAILTGVGEFILHFDPLARFGDAYVYLAGIGASRATAGHFIGVLGAPLYLVGCWHIQLMLRPASAKWSLIAFLVAAYGFVIGTVWIGSRASIIALTNTAPSPDIDQLVALYDFRYETLLQLIRLAVLVLSAIFIWLVLTGRSHYPKWMAALNPILLIILSFVVFAVSPVVGKYLMPIALNVAFTIFFVASTRIAIAKGV